MTPEEIESVAVAAADRAVRTTLLSLGIDISDHRSVLATQLDFQHLRAWRESTEAVKRKALMTAVTVIVTGALGYLVLVMRSGASH